MSRSYAQRFPVPPWRYRLSTVVERRLDEFNAQDLVNTAWAFATVGQQDEQLFKALARMAERRLDKFNV